MPQMESENKKVSYMFLLCVKNTRNQKDVKKTKETVSFCIKKGIPRKEETSNSRSYILRHTISIEFIDICVQEIRELIAGIIDVGCSGSSSRICRLPFLRSSFSLDVHPDLDLEPEATSSVTDDRFETFEQS